MENRSRPCSLNPGLLSSRGLCGLGSKIRQVSHVPSTLEAEPSHSCIDPRNHLHIRRQLLFRPPLLAYAILQRIRTRSSRCWHSRTSYRIQYPGRSCACALFAQCPQRSQQGVDDCQLYCHDSGYVFGLRDSSVVSK